VAVAERAAAADEEDGTAVAEGTAVAAPGARQIQAGNVVAVALGAARRMLTRRAAGARVGVATAEGSAEEGMVPAGPRGFRKGALAAVALGVTGRATAAGARTQTTTADEAEAAEGAASVAGRRFRFGGALTAALGVTGRATAADVRTQTMKADVAEAAEGAASVAGRRFRFGGAHGGALTAALGMRGRVASKPASVETTAAATVAAAATGAAAVAAVAETAATAMGARMSDKPPRSTDVVIEAPTEKAPSRSEKKKKKQRKTQAERVAELSTPRFRDDRIQPGCHAYKPPVRGLAYRGSVEGTTFVHRNKELAERSHDGVLRLDKGKGSHEDIKAAIKERQFTGEHLRPPTEVVSEFRLSRRSSKGSRGRSTTGKGEYPTKA